MNKVNQIIRIKGNRVWKISKDTTVLEALQLMAEKQVGSVLIMEGNRVEGIFTERDFARKVGVVDAKPSTVKVGEVMSSNVITISPSDSVNTCMELMTEKHIRHLPVLDKDHLVGLVSIGDVVKDVIGELKSMVKHLEDYITGTR